MNSIPLITSSERAELNQLHTTYRQEVKYAALSTAAATFLWMGALIVITSSCLCLTLPGVNVLRDVISPGVIPGILAILISAPLIATAVKHNQSKDVIRKQIINRMGDLLVLHQVPAMPRKHRINFILKNFLNWTPHPDKPNKLLKNIAWMDDYQAKILTDIKDRLGKKEDFTPRQKKIDTAIDKARVKIIDKVSKD